MDKKVAAVVITDTHLDDTNEEQVENVFQQTINLCREYGLKKFYHAGDQFNSRVSQKLSTLLAFQRIIDLLETSGIKMVTIAGNHDKTDQTVEESYLDIYSSPNLEVINEINTHDYYSDNGVNILLLPFFEDKFYKEHLRDLSNRRSKKGNNVLLTHIGIHGVLNNSGVDEGNSVNVGDFKDFDLVLIGHYHNASSVNDKIKYIGSTDPRNYGEDSKKGATLIYTDLSTEQVKFHFKDYVKIQITEFEEHKIIKQIEELSKGLNTSNIRLEFLGKESDLVNIDNKVFESKGFSVNKVTVASLHASNEIQEGVKHSLNLDESKILSELKEYCEENNIKSSKLAKIIKHLKQ